MARRFHFLLTCFKKKCPVFRKNLKNLKFKKIGKARKKDDVFKKKKRKFLFDIIQRSDEILLFLFFLRSILHMVFKDILWIQNHFRRRIKIISL